ncbi:MAG TPA: preprotein translocase subunit SecY [Patescibacteria group bacterium]
MWNAIIRFWQLKDLRRKVIVTIFLLAIARTLIYIPLPLIQTSALKELFAQNAFLGFLNIFSGGGLENFSIITMGVGPYITASIIMQLMGVIIPSLEELQQEGEYGQKKINQYTRLLTLPLAIIQAYSVLLLLKQNGVILDWTPVNVVVTLIMMATGTLFVMWLGEIISERGIGNGISLLITLGIIGALPLHIQNMVSTAQTSGNYTMILSLLAITLLSIVFVIIVNEAKRLIPIAYARRIRTGGFGSVPSYLPIKVNTAGVVPIIFAIAILTVPAFLGQFLSQARSEWLAKSAQWLTTTFQPSSNPYNIVYFLLVFIFTFFYTYIIFKPEKIAENLQKQGGYIPGVRPGTETIRYLQKIVNRITLFGALFIALIAILPVLLQYQFPSQAVLLSGTSLLIVISVVLETGRQIQSQYIMRTYDAYA